MIILCAGLILFFVPHLLRELGLRQSVIGALPSEAAYKGLYTLVALAGLALIIWGKSSSPFIMIWQPVFELRSISHILMIPALVLLVAGNMPMSFMRKILRNPMLLGVFLWSLSHLWSNGDLASVILFGSFALWAGLKFISLGFTTKSTANSPSPKGDIISLLTWDFFALIGGLILYALVGVYHGQLFGVGLNLA